MTLDEQGFGRDPASPTHCYKIEYAQYWMCRKSADVTAGGWERVLSKRHRRQHQRGEQGKVNLQPSLLNRQMDQAGSQLIQMNEVQFYKDFNHNNSRGGKQTINKHI